MPVAVFVCPHSLEQAFFFEFFDIVFNVAFGLLYLVCNFLCIDHRIRLHKQQNSLLRIR
jgi:hypothetical protein